MSEALIQRSGTTDVPHLLLNRPKSANALNRALLRQLVAAVTDAVEGGARALVLAGAGRGFSAGADFGEMHGDASDIEIDYLIAEAATALVSAPIPIVAALHRYCFGGAVDIAWACDLVVATPATRIAVPATRLGILYNPAALRRLSARMGAVSARRLYLFGEELSGQEAHRAGLVSHLADASQIVAVANQLAHNAIRGSAPAVAATKQFLNTLESGQVDTAYWQTKREALWQSAERIAALQQRKQ